MGLGSGLPGWVVALDIGGSHVSAATVDLNRREVRAGTFRRVEAGGGDAGALLDTWADAALAAAPTGEVLAVGLAVPGPFEYDTGVSRLRHKLGALYGLNVVDGLRARWAGTPLAARPVHLMNDASAFALGEWWVGGARPRERLIGLTLGTGLGSGFVAGGRVVTRGSGVPPGGELWAVPYLGGTAEQFACGAAVSRTYAQLTGPDLTAEQIAGRAAHDPRARRAFEELGTHLARVLRPHVEGFGASRVVVGGGVARAWPLFGPHLQAGLGTLPCLPSGHLDRAALLGVAAFVGRALARRDGG